LERGRHFRGFFAYQIGSPTVSHMYATAGAFTVTLTVTNICGLVEVTYPITVQPAVTSNNIYLPIVQDRRQVACTGIPWGVSCPLCHRLVTGPRARA
jgi:hypothetical protein